MYIIITIIAVIIGLYLAFTAGIYFGQGTLVGFLMKSTDDREVAVGEEWSELIDECAQDEEECWLGRLIVRLTQQGKEYAKRKA